MTSEPSEVLNSIIAGYMLNVEQGRAVDRVALLARHPEHAAGLQSFFTDYDRMQAAVEGDHRTDDAEEDATCRYDILDEIARGGMGAVLRATDRWFNRPVALKILREDRANKTLQQRFEFESGVTGRLQHPGIPPVYDMGRLPDGRVFFAMKLIEGRTLQDLLSERPAPTHNLAHFVGVFAQICQTLAYAHSVGVIHRDLKPLNVMVGAFGEVQVMDWGMARELKGAKPTAAEQETGFVTAGGDSTFDAESETIIAQPPPTVDYVREGAEADSDAVDDRMTNAGDVMGTLTYMPPEQALGQIERLNERSDVFALGAILCHTLTGEPPYRNAGTASLLDMARQADLTDAFARLDACGADREVIDLAKQCLAAEPEQRPASAGVVAAEVTGYLETVEQRLQDARVERAKAIEEQKRRRVSQRLTLVVLLVALVVAVVVPWYWQARNAQIRKVEAQTRKVEAEIGDALTLAEQDLEAINENLADEKRYRDFTNSFDNWDGLLQNARSNYEKADDAARVGGVEIVSATDDRLSRTLASIDHQESLYKFAERLDLARFQVTTRLAGPGGVKANISWASRAFGQEFAGNGWNINQQTTDELIEFVKQSEIRYALIGAIDFWILATQNEPWRAELLRVASEVDSDAWRNRVRNPKNWGDAGKLLELAVDPVAPEQSPPMLQVLAILLARAGEDPQPMLQRALARHPRDFALHHTLAVVAKHPEAKLGAYRAAIAVRPYVGPEVHDNVGRLYFQLEEYDLAESEFRLAVKLAPDYIPSYNNLGLTLIKQGEFVEAEKVLQRAIELNSRHVLAINNLGIALEGQERIEAALAAYRKAVALAPGYREAQNNLSRLESVQEKEVVSP